MLATKYQRYGYVHMEPFLPGKAIMIQFIIFIIHWNVQQHKNVVVFPTPLPQVTKLSKDGKHTLFRI